jgi:hypothetical protein
MTSCLGQLRCEEKEFSHRLGGFGRCVLDWSPEMPERPEFEVGRSYIYIYGCMYIYTYIYVVAHA